GQYHSVFKGRGRNFDEFRLYQIGDEIRSIDWNVTARTGETYVRKYVEERELTVMVMVDLSASGGFGSRQASKREVAAEVASLIAFCAIRNNDKVGLLLFTDRVELFVPPRKGRTHTLRLIREVLFFKPAGHRTNLAEALTFLNRVVARKAVVFLLSDFHAEHYEQGLAIAARRHDLIAVPMEDPGDADLPSVGVISAVDPETGHSFLINSSDRRVRDAFREATERHRRERDQLFRRYNIDAVPLRTDQDYFPLLRAFFLRREKRLKAA
ncbi:MAG TPA: DUF58 domain-containing protein, partial [Chthoniobacterales bacterium]